jgi:biopolymer transport protein ExbD
MTFSHCLCLFLMTALLSGCTTSKIVAEGGNTEIKLTTSGEIVYRDKTVAKEQLPDLLRGAHVKREETIRILVPATQEQRDYLLMRALTDTLKSSGFGRIIFVTDKKATANLKEKKR